MIRKFSLMFTFVLLAFGIAASGSGVAAQTGPFPANNENACTRAGGEFSQENGVNYCTVGGIVSAYEPSQASGKSGRGWTAVYSIVENTVYEKDNGDTDVNTTTSYTFVSCTNPGGNSVSEADCALQPPATPES